MELRYAQSTHASETHHAKTNTMHVYYLFMRLTCASPAQEAVTAYKALRTACSLKYETVTWVELKPYTGRTHQLRRHMLGIGRPLIGDKDYLLPQWYVACVHTPARLIVNFCIYVHMLHPCLYTHASSWILHRDRERERDVFWVLQIFTFIHTGTHTAGYIVFKAKVWHTYVQKIFSELSWMNLKGWNSHSMQQFQRVMIFLAINTVCMELL